MNSRSLSSAVPDGTTHMFPPLDNSQSFLSHWMYTSFMTRQKDTWYKRYFIPLVLIVILALFLPVIMYLTRQSQDIRPLALAGQANLLLSASDMSPNTGGTFDVVITVQLTDPNVRISGADILLLYDKSKLQVDTITPATTGTGAPFTDAPILTKQMSSAEAGFDALRIAVVSNKPNTQLAKGAAKIGTVRFKAAAVGSAVIKFPIDNDKIDIVGIKL